MIFSSLQYHPLMFVNITQPGSDPEYCVQDKYQAYLRLPNLEPGCQRKKLEFEINTITQLADGNTYIGLHQGGEASFENNEDFEIAVYTTKCVLCA